MKILKIYTEDENLAKALIPEISCFGGEFGKRYLEYESKVIDQYIEEGLTTREEVETPVNLRPQNDFFDIVFADHEEWSKSHVNKVEGLISGWESLKEKIFNAIVLQYKKQYKSARREEDTGDLVMMILPDPDENFIRNVSFCLCAIHLNLDSKFIGMTGNCVWEEEHGVGLLINTDDWSVKVGYANIAFI